MAEHAHTPDKDHPCPDCAGPATPHCTSGHCIWLTCTDVKCGVTWHPGRPDILLRITS